MTIPTSRPDIQARTYDELFQFGGKLKTVRREHQRILPFFTKAHKVLDVGCGRGVFMQMLREVGVTPIGVDLSPESVRYCQDLGFDQVFHEDAISYLRHNVGAFDGVVCSHIVEHMPYDDVLELMRAAHAALAPGGRLAIVTPNARDLRVIGEMFWLDPTHVRPYPLPLLDSMLRSAGFNIIHKAQPLGMPNKRGLLHWPFQVLLLGVYFGHPNTIIIGER